MKPLSSSLSRAGSGALVWERGARGGGVCRWDGYDWEYYHRLGSAFDMGNRRIVEELKHIVNFET